jgi:hypothetical protein
MKQEPRHPGNAKLARALMSMIITAQQRGDNRYAAAVRRALGSLCKYPVRLRTKDEALLLIGVGPALGEKIARLLAGFASSSSHERQQPSPPLLPSSSSSSAAAAAAAPSGAAKKMYTPKFGSGPWCLVLAAGALLAHGQSRTVNRDVLQRCMASIFAQIEAGGGGSGVAHAKKAWAPALRTLVAKGLAVAEPSGGERGRGRPAAVGRRSKKRFAPTNVALSLTAAGTAGARALASAAASRASSLSLDAACAAARGEGESAGAAAAADAASAEPPLPQRQRLSAPLVAEVNDDDDTSDEGSGVIDLASSPLPSSPTPSAVPFAAAGAAAASAAAPPARALSADGTMRGDSRSSRSSRRSSATAASASAATSSSASTAAETPLEQQQKLRDLWEVVLIVDQREVRSRRDRDYLRARLLEAGVHCEVRQLDLGDMLWIARRREGAHASAAERAAEIMVGHIVERKKVSDLAASIIGRRYKDQKRRLKVRSSPSALFAPAPPRPRPRVPPPPRAPRHFCVVRLCWCSFSFLGARHGVPRNAAVASDVPRRGCTARAGHPRPGGAPVRTPLHGGRRHRSPAHAPH